MCPMPTHEFPSWEAGPLSSRIPDRVSFPVRVERALLTALTGRETLSGMRELNSHVSWEGLGAGFKSPNYDEFEYMLKKLFIITLLLLLVYIVFVDNVTSRIIFSNQSLSSKLLGLVNYFLRSLLHLLWRLIKAFFFLVIDLWYRYTGYLSPSYNIRDFKELYQLYQDVAAWSGLPWQVFWGNSC